MLRVHGDKVLRRRKGITGLQHYSQVKAILQEDFHDLCGYCGKNRKMMHQGFHIDHFVPKTVDPDRKNDYYNLVLACSKCNLSKSNKWPTNDKNLENDGTVGFVDPATEAYDLHLTRDEHGYVVGITELGKNISKSLHFDIRRTDLYWKIQKLYQMQKEMEEIKQKLSREELLYYVETNEFLKSYIDEAFEKGE